MHLSQKYFPSFSTREAELKAYKELPSPIRDPMLPAVTLTRQKFEQSLYPSLSVVREAAQERPLIIDFDPMPKTLTTEGELREERRLSNEKRKFKNKKPFTPSQKQISYWNRLRAD